ncbi:MAG: chorismate-binding protein [Clostridium sp.]|nr:chorismate-binding protein [Prevotella sp.]MCM1428731.1 chorismate-binding protein [Clostridium sp.]MCM1475106.1 chorismate-binding protein [Muribaculaceae bacterium]
MNYFAYRLPGEKEIVKRASNRDLSIEGNSLPELPAEGGFIAAPFRIEDWPTIIIPSDEVLAEIPQRVDGGYIGFFPGQSTLRETYQEEILGIQELLRNLSEKIQRSSKIVAARVLLQEGEFNPREIFHKLCGLPGDNFVFLFYTPQTGLWMGASPELLLSYNSEGIRTMSLAGTREAGSNEEWDLKNTLEQKTVTDFITKEIAKNGYIPEILPTYTKKTGTVEHLCTPIRGIIQTQKAKATPLRIANRLSPTPALSGYPREEAIAFLTKKEEIDRGYYGGYCGPITETTGKLYVNLRSGCFIPGWGALYAGGGITLLSESDKEWEETERKLKAMLTGISD